MNLATESSKEVAVELQNGQIESLKALIVEEMERNEKNDDAAYNTYWLHVLDRL